VVGSALRAMRRNMQIIFQDPTPRSTAHDGREIIGEPLLIHGIAHGKEMRSA